MRLWILVLLIFLSAGVQADGDIVAYQSDNLPQAPQRIVSLDDLSTELLVSLGIEPVGVGNLEGYRRWVKLGSEHLTHSAPLGSAQQPNLEQLVKLKPDLIVGISSLHSALFVRLDALAPTVLYDVSMAPSSRDAVAAGEQMLTHLAQLTQREYQARKVLDEMHAALANARTIAEQVGISREPLAVLYPLPQQGLFIVSNEQTLVVSLANRLGGRNPWPLNESHSLHERIEVNEVARQPNLNLLFIGGFKGSPFFDSTLWRALPVARHGAYGFLETPYWSFGGPWSATVIVGQMAEAIKAMDESDGAGDSSGRGAD